MESELSSIFRVKLVTKNIVCGFPGTQFMHMKVNVWRSNVLILRFCQLMEYYIEKIFVETFEHQKANFSLLHWQGESLTYSVLTTALYLI